MPPGVSTKPAPCLFIDTSLTLSPDEGNDDMLLQRVDFGLCSYDERQHEGEEEDDDEIARQQLLLSPEVIVTDTNDVVKSRHFTFRDAFIGVIPESVQMLDHSFQAEQGPSYGGSTDDSS